MLATLLTLTFLFIAAVADAQIQPGIQYDVYFLAGQSNAAGRGDASELSGIQNGMFAGIQNDVQLFWRSTNSSSNGNLTQNRFVPLQVDSGEGFASPRSHAVEFGVEISMGRTLADAFPNRNIAIIKYAHGGSNLHTDWAPNGNRYNTFVDVASDALAAITDAGATYHLRGFAWIQGESDTSNANSANYQSNLTSLISRIRNDVFEGQQALAIISRLSDNQYNSLSSGVNSVRAAQVAVANADDAAEWVDTDGTEFSTYASPNLIHFNAEGVIAIGTSLGSVFIATDSGSQLAGDFDSDDDVDCDDINFFVGNIGSPATGNLAPLDLNGDNQITSDDSLIHVTTLVQTTNSQTGTFLGDLNCDGRVDVLGDGVSFIANLGNPDATYTEGDINFDGRVDVLGDAFILITNLGMSNAP